MSGSVRPDYPAASPAPANQAQAAPGLDALCAVLCLPCGSGLPLRSHLPASRRHAARLPSLHGAAVTAIRRSCCNSRFLGALRRSPLLRLPRQENHSLLALCGWAPSCTRASPVPPAHHRYPARLLCLHTRHLPAPEARRRGSGGLAAITRNHGSHLLNRTPWLMGQFWPPSAVSSTGHQGRVTGLRRACRHRNIERCRHSPCTMTASRPLSLFSGSRPEAQDRLCCYGLYHCHVRPPWHRQPALHLPAYPPTTGHPEPGERP